MYVAYSWISEAVTIMVLKSLAFSNAANMVGALSLGVADRIVEETETLINAGANAPAALTLIGSKPGITIDDLRHGIRLTHSATVRTVMRLHEAGLVEKHSGQDARSVYLRLSPKGRREMKRALKLRETILEGMLSALSELEVDMLKTLVVKILPNVVSTTHAVDAICRLCNEKVCPDSICPLSHL